MSVKRGPPNPKPTPMPRPKGSKLKRYLIFQFPLYHPAGGWNDLKTSVDTLKEAELFFDCRFILQVIDNKTGEIIII